VNGCGIVAAAERTRAEAIRRASSVGSSRSVLSFLESAPLRYLAHRSADEVLEDARLVQSLAGPGRIGEFASGRRPGAAPETWLLHVVTRDRPGLFATVAGVLALSGIDVLAAEAYTTSSGIALDTFTVASATRAPLDDGRWGLFERRLGETLNGTLDLEARLAEHRRHYDRTRTGGPTPRITIDGPMTFSTAVRVRTADRVGLLHDLAHAFEGAGLDIRRAVITTQAATADDVFEVTDAEGAPPQADTLHDTLVPLLEAVLRAT
jgi:[protein-PII] uridylyltransferase